MSLSRVNIQEANEHLKQLHQKVFELENQVQMKEMHIEDLQKTNLELQQRLHSLSQKQNEKEAEVSELSRKLEESEQLVQRLLEAAQERDAAVLKLEAKARLFYEIVEHRPVLTRIVQVLDELSTDVSNQVENEGDRESEGGKESEEGSENEFAEGGEVNTLNVSNGTSGDTTAHGNESSERKETIHVQDDTVDHT